jgi:cytochrome c oxidase cbb3-type subunit 3
MSSEPHGQPPHEDNLRPHTFDGIQEYDKRLPNWWLLTLYGAIAFAVAYWFVHYEASVVLPDGERVTQELNRVEAVKLAAMVDKLNDPYLWQASRNSAIVANGAATFRSVCQACHAPNLRGRAEDPKYIGANLTDNAWLHGGLPTEVFKLVRDGYLPRGMPPRGGQPLSDMAVLEAVAFVLSHHREGEPILVEQPPVQ